jgi:hypothetical protein
MHGRCIGGQTSEAWLTSERIDAPKMLEGCEDFSFAFYQRLPTTLQQEGKDRFSLR